MSNRTNRRRSFRQVVNCDLELRPLMNVFIVLIPMLLMSAVFMEIRVIEMSMPRDVLAAAHTPVEKPFDVTIRIRANAYVVEAGGSVLSIVPRRAGMPGQTTSDELTRVLAAIVAGHPGNKEVRIVAESTTRYEEIVAIMDLARDAGLPQAALEGAEMEGA